MDANEKLNFLAQSIKNARKVMEKVEDKTTFSPNNRIQQPTVRKSLNEDDIDRLLDSQDHLISEDEYKTNVKMKNLSTSKMPEAIKKSFMENPIIDPTAPIGMESIMQEITKKAAPIDSKKVVNEQFVSKPTPTNTNIQLDTKLIEYIIRKTVEETLEQVSKKTSIDENIVIKIGDKTFGGKINTLKEIKK